VTANDCTFNRRLAAHRFRAVAYGVVLLAAFLVVVMPTNQLSCSASAHQFRRELAGSYGGAGRASLDRSVGLRRSFRFSRASRWASLRYATFALVPSISPYRDAIPDAVALAALGLVAVRVVWLGGSWVRCSTALVLGTAGDAAILDQALHRLAGRDHRCGFY
jgi:hypothetical protein